MGIGPKLDTQNGQAMEYKEGYVTDCVTPNMADDLDTQIDILLEKYGAHHEEVIRAVVKDLKAPMELEIERSRALMLGRVACYLVKSEHKNVLARVHQLLHAIPRLAMINGFRSMRASARICGVSAQWIKIGRDNWCEVLGIPIPHESQKTEQAKGKYRANANSNHWRAQRVSAKTKTK